MTVQAQPDTDEQPCVFNPQAFAEFRSQYLAQHPDAYLAADGQGFRVSAEHAEVEVSGGGCLHLGVSVREVATVVVDEADFLLRVARLAHEFTGWLINTEQLQQSIRQRRWQRHGGIYSFTMDEMTVFEAWYENDGSVSINAYIN